MGWGRTKGGRVQQAEGWQVEGRGQGTGSRRWKGRGWDPRVRGRRVKRGEQEGGSRAMQSCKGACKGQWQGVHLERIIQRTFWVLYSSEVLRGRGTVKSLGVASDSHERVLKSKNGTSSARTLSLAALAIHRSLFSLLSLPSSFPKTPHPVPLVCLHFSLFLLWTYPHCFLVGPQILRYQKSHYGAGTEALLLLRDKMA